jgi:riboflavin kinase/FMN adenylyltransferase
VATVVRHPGGPCPAPPQGCAVTIGSYDGVHRGHRVVIAELQARAASLGLATGVVTFDRHPAQVVRPESAPLQLTDLDQEIELLAATGVDHIVVVTFDEVRSKEPAEDFVREILIGCLNAKLVIVGSDFHFGHERRGNVGLLAQMGADLGFAVEGMALVDLAGAPAAAAEARVSSTAVRRALAAGDLAAANEMLGRPHEVRGIVTAGAPRPDGSGSTATVVVARTCQLPADGVYAVWHERPDGSVHPGAAAIGDGSLGVHLLDVVDGDLVGEQAKLRFVERLRDDAADVLIAEDRRRAREALGA